MLRASALSLKYVLTMIIPGCFVKIYLFVCLFVYVCVRERERMYVVFMQVPMESGRGLSDPPELEFLVGVSSLMWVLGTEFGSSRGAARVAAEPPLQLQVAVLNEDTKKSK